MSGAEKPKATIKVELTPETKRTLDEIIKQVKGLTDAAQRSITHVRRYSVGALVVSAVTLVILGWHMIVTCPAAGEWFVDLFGG